jgi:hypothetical protein
MKIPIFIAFLFLSACSSDTLRSGSDNAAEYYPTYTRDLKDTLQTLYYPAYTRDLEDTLRTLNLTYISWFCQCANWAREADFQKNQNLPYQLGDKLIFIEPADSTLELPDTLGYSGDLIRFIGRFYKDRGFPKKYPKTEMEVKKAKVFKYTKFEVLKSGYREFVDDKPNTE